MVYEEKNVNKIIHNNERFSQLLLKDIFLVLPGASILLSGYLVTA